MSDAQTARWRAAWARSQNERPRDYGLEPAPIPADWILEGSPLTRARKLADSTDGRAFTVMWDCTASRFNWFYDVDETICVLEGSVILTDPQGQRHSLHPMDTFLFPNGSRYHWNVPVYVRKLAFIHVPLPAKLQYARRIYRSVKALFGAEKKKRNGGQSADGPGAALGGG